MHRVRRYRSADLGAVKRLFREISRTHRSLYRPRRRPKRDPDRSYRTHLRKYGPVSLRVVECEERVVGLVGLIRHGDSCEIEPFIVARRYRGRGLGGELIRAVVAEAKSRGWRTLSASVAARNEEALRALYALGFRTLTDLALSKTVTRPALFSLRSGPKIAGRRFHQ